MSKLSRDHRNTELAQIHVAKKQLTEAGIFRGDEDYRQMLWTQGRVTSAAGLDHAGRLKVIDHLRSLGFKPAKSKRPVPAADKLKQIKKIRAQLISLGNLKDRYADGIAQRMFKVDFYEWCNHEQLHAISAALSYEQNRKGAPTK
ncbi:MAG: regulatory protein GemA [Ramlibacter sp.]|nr:regulatory protein GemA [Ramlibacter sp.]